MHGPSQYPHEKECLFAPLTGIEVQGTRIDGAVLVIEARLSVNLNALTIEQARPAVIMCKRAWSRVIPIVYSHMSARAAQVVSKRRKVVADMASNVLADFGRGLDDDENAVWAALWEALALDADWAALWEALTRDADSAALGQSALAVARHYLKGSLEPLTTELPEHYNEDALLGAAINAAVFRADAVRGWGKGVVALASRSGHEMAPLLELDSLVLNDALTDSKEVWDGIGALLVLGKLRVLELGTAAQLGAAGAARLAVELGSSSLTSVDLAGNNLGAEGGKAIAEAISASRSMTSIHLKYNSLGVEGGKAIAKAVAASSSLKSIHLGNNDLGVEGGKAIAQAISKSKSLTSIDLYNNKLGVEGGTAIAEAISESKSLTSIDLRSNDLGVETCEAIAKAISTSSSLTSIK